MVMPQNKRRTTRILLYGITIVVAVVGLSIFEYNTIIARHLFNVHDESKHHYNIIYAQYKQLADVIFSSYINRNEISVLLNKANHASSKERDILRTQLYDQIRQTYAILQNYHIQQLHFHLKNSESFLRLHRPRFYGDSLIGVRESVEYVNREQKAIDGFEEGKNYNGYRFVFPLFDDTLHVGSVEISFATSAFIKEFKKSLGEESYVLLRKNVVDTKVLDRKHFNYKLSMFENYYLGAKEPIEGLSQCLNSSMIQSVNRARPTALYSESCQAVLSFINIQNPVTKAHVAYFVIVSPDTYVMNQKQNIALRAVLVLLAVGLLFAFLYNNTLHKEEIESQNVLLSRQKNAQNELIKEQRSLLSLFDKGDAVLFKWNNDAHWSVAYVSASVSNLFGYDKQAFEEGAVLYAQCVHSDDLSRVIDEVTQAVNSGSTFFKHRPYRIISKTGTTHWILDDTVIERLEDGSVSHYIGYIHDITPEYEAQEALQQLNASLQDRIYDEVKKSRERDEKIQQHARLAQMGEMLSMIAHQWRQPLGSIAMAIMNIQTKVHFDADELKETDTRETFVAYLSQKSEEIAEYVHFLSTTIDDFRNFFKPDKQKEVISFSEPVRRALHILTPMLEHNEVKLEIDLSNENEVMLYPNEWMQVVINIIKNAEENFIDKEQVDRYIHIRTFESESDHILSIQDNGGGIDKSILPQIFDPYFSTKYEKNGTGLGLYMSKMIIGEHHRGLLEATNEDGGVCFRVFLSKSSQRMRTGENA